jgi:hypothetical protein
MTWQVLVLTNVHSLSRPSFAAERAALAKMVQVR